MLIFVFAVSTALVVSFLCSVFESVLLSVGYARVEALNQRGRRAGAILSRFKREMDVPIAAILILNTIAHTVGASVAGASYGNVFDPSTLWLFSIVFTVAVLLFTEIVPKTLGISFADALAGPVATAVQLLVTGLGPVLVVTRVIARLLRSGTEPAVTSTEEIRLLAVAGRAQGVVGAKIAGIIAGATRLPDLTAEHVMIPRTRVAWIAGDRPLAENLELLRTSRHSRVPFSPDGELDHAEGVVLAKELLFRVQAGEPIDWQELLVPPIRVAESEPLIDLLRKFQSEYRHLAFVQDEHGGLAGIVTLEDVLEELVGEIWDESDQRQPDIVEQPDGALMCQGLAEARKVFARLGLRTESTAITLSGFLAERLGAIPRVGDTIEEGAYRFTVTRATARRASQVEIRPVASGPDRA